MIYNTLTVAQKAMYDDSHVERVSTGVAIRLPRTEALQAKYPHYTFHEDDWKQVSRALKEFALAKLPAPTLSAPVEIPIKGTSAHTPARGASTVPVSSEQEARIRELSGDRLVQVAAANQVIIMVHPTNPGITAMRRKNALLTLFRHGTSVQNL